MLVRLVRDVFAAALLPGSAQPDDRRVPDEAARDRPLEGLELVALDFERQVRDRVVRRHTGCETTRGRVRDRRLRRCRPHRRRWAVRGRGHQQGRRVVPDPRPGDLPDRRCRRERCFPGPVSLVDRDGVAHRRRGPHRHPLRGRDGRRVAPLPARLAGDHRPRRPRHVRHGARRRAVRPCRARLQLGACCCPRRGACADRPGRDVLRARPQGDSRADRHNASRRVGRERSSGDLADDRRARVRHERQRIVLVGLVRVRLGDGGRPRARRPRRDRAPGVDAPDRPRERDALPDTRPRVRRRPLRRHHARAWLGLPRRVRGGSALRRHQGAL